MNQHSSAAKLLQQQNVLDPNIPQRMASNPLESVWVGASAGTGKTKVLTDRVLRLLLPRNDGGPATPAHRILCLTYTKAAASEMALRINRTLGAWAVLEIEALKGKLENLLGQGPDGAQIMAAQRLFADVMDTPGGLQIMTIHSFCQSVLGRFPLEAALSPNFTLLEDTLATELLQQAKMQVLERAQCSEFKGSPLAQAFDHVGGELDERIFSSLIREISGERNQLSILFRSRSIEQVYAALCAHYDIAQNMRGEDVLAALCEDAAFDLDDLRETAKAMLEDGGKTSVKDGSAILHWLSLTPAQRCAEFAPYKRLFFTSQGDIRVGSFPVSGVLKVFPKSIDILRGEANRLLEAQDRLNRLKSATMTGDILLIGKEILETYADLKRKRGGLDFDDLILRTMDLLRGETPELQGMEQASAWIMYKLDQGLDHILIDEAQDTNPEHWKIIEALCDEFFRGMAAREDVRRSAFVVGDIKQSIYSFQRAAPEEFQRMQGVFAQKIKNAGQISRNIDLEISFRTTGSVLRLVDHVFAEETLNRAVGGGDIHHVSHRSKQAGRAEIWPLCENDEQEKPDLWAPPLTVKGKQSASSKLAGNIAQTIKGWIDSGEILPSAARPIEAGDIMVLVRSRSAFVEQLVRALKLKSVPVSGVDRMRIGEQLVVQDMLAAARFALLPEDDLTLACLLKSPFLGWSEDEVFALCHKRKGSVWAELAQYNAAKFANETWETYPVLDAQKQNQAFEYMKKIIEIGRSSGAYEFFCFLLHTPCPADPHSGLRAITSRLGEDALDPLEELMNAALRFGRQEIDSLQLFLAKQEHNEADLKREMEESGGKVRIMTVHGSKGLQAPIVILPDTVKTAQSGKISRLLWPNKTGLEYPLWSPRKDDDPAAYKRLYEACAARSEEEEARLLYVAMTRAADRLYIAGYKPKRGNIDNSWYSKVHRAFEEDETAQDMEDGILRIENPQTGEPDQAKKAQPKGRSEEALPDWISKAAPQEPSPPRPLIPSRPSKADQMPALSPLTAGRDFRFRRGTVTHKLLQFLPEFKPEKRAASAQYFLEKTAQDLPADVQQNILKEVIDILENPDFEGFFRYGSLAEVAVTGLMADGRIISGQIDRLVVGEKDIWILDYKTNRPPPTDPKDIPQTYRSQLAAYRESVAAIYPHHKIYTALLWTDGPRLMMVE